MKKSPNINNPSEITVVFKDQNYPIKFNSNVTLSGDSSSYLQLLDKTMKLKEDLAIAVVEEDNHMDSTVIDFKIIAP